MRERRRQTTRAVAGAVAVVAVIASACSSPGSGGSQGSGGPSVAGSVATSGVGGGPRSGAGGASVVAGWRQVAGTDGRDYVADASGRALQFRGFNIKTRDPLADASDELLEAGRVRGFNLLRLSIYWDQFEPERGRVDERYLDDVKTVLDRAAEHDIFVILDFHQDVFGPKFGDHGIPVWATKDDGLPYAQQPVWLLNYLQPAVQAAWENLYEDPEIRKAQQDAWAAIATRYRSHPALFGYDLLNEPFGKVRPGEDVATAATRVQAEQLTAMYQRLTDAIHAVDPDHWVFFEPPNVASLGVPVALGTVEGDKLAFFPHFYDPAIEGATYTEGAEIGGFASAFFENYEKAIRPYIDAHDYPTLFGEWGLAHPDAAGMDEFVARSLALMDRRGSGWTVFTWCARDSGYCVLDADGKDRAAMGQLTQPWARAIAGSPTSFVWDRGARTLTVVFADSDATGPTELVVPASVYPNGWKVATSDRAGTWSEERDGLVVRVTTPRTGSTHTICLAPADAILSCG